MSRSPVPTVTSSPTTANISTSAPAVLSFFILYCEGKTRTARSLFQEEIVKPSPGSRQISLEDFQNVVRDLVVNQELFDSMLRPQERPINAPLPQGRSFKCLRGATFALHQYCSGGTGIRFFLMTDPNYNSGEAQRKLAAIYQGPFLDLVCHSESISLRDLLDQAPIIVSGSGDNNNTKNKDNTNNNNNIGVINDLHQRDVLDNNDAATLKQILEHDQPPRLLPALPANIHSALRTEVLAILRGH